MEREDETGEADGKQRVDKPLQHSLRMGDKNDDLLMQRSGISLDQQLKQ